MISEAIGAERQLVVNVVLLASRNLPQSAVASASITVMDHLEGGQVARLLRPPNFEDYLRIVQSGPASRRPHAEALVVRAARSGSDDAREALRAFNRLSSAGQKQLRDVVAELARGKLDALQVALEGVPAETVDFVARGPTASVLADRLSIEDDQAYELVESVVTSLSPHTAWAILTPTVASGDQDRLAAVAGLVEKSPPAPPRAGPANALLRAMTIDTERRRTYATHVPSRRLDRPVETTVLAQALSTCVSAASPSAEELQVSIDAVTALMPLINSTSAELESALKPLADELAVPFGGEEVAGRRQQHGILMLLADRDARRAQTWVRLLATSAAALLMTGLPITSEGQKLFSAVVQRATRPPEDRTSLARLEQALRDDRPTPTAGVFRPDRRRFELAHVLRSLLRNGWPLESSVDDTIDAARAGKSSLDGGAIAVLTDAIRPTLQQRPELIRAAIARAERDDWDAAELESYFKSLGAGEALNQMRHAVESGIRVPSRVFEWVRAKVDETQWTKYLIERLEAASTDRDRNLTLGYISRVNPEKRANQRRIADAVIASAERGGKGSFSVVARWTAEMVVQGQLGQYREQALARLRDLRALKYRKVRLPKRTDAALAEAGAERP